MTDEQNLTELFEQLFSNDEIKLLKILIFFIDPKDRKQFILFIKLKELLNCISNNGKYRADEEIFLPTDPLSMEDKICRLKVFLPEKQREMVDQYLSMKEMMELLNTSDFEDLLNNEDIISKINL